MAYSSIMGADKAPAQPSGRGSDLLGPSDNSDSGSDAIGTQEMNGDSDSRGTGERGAVAGADAVEGGDIMPDHVVRLGGGGGAMAADADSDGFTDLDDDAEEEDDETDR
ncbi:MAG TPA: hypothetical protein VLJ86_04580 [Ramlibacter sp.]|nr:hypothetical protein [Ramlibacter sp.]